MSRLRDQKLCFWQDVLAQLRRNTHRTYGSVELEHQDTVCEVLFLYTALWCDMLNLDPIEDSRRLRRIVGVVATCDISDLMTFCDFYRDFITHYEIFGFRSGESRDFHGGLDYRTFKQYVRLKTPESTWSLSWDMGTLVRPFLANPTPKTFRPLNQICTFPCRLNVPRPDLEVSLTEDYVRRDGDISFVETDFTNTMKAVIHEWFSDWRLTPVQPNHGPGSCAEFAGRNKVDKYHHLGGDAALFDWIRSTGQNPWKWYFTLPGSFDRCSKLIFVPKSAKTLRAINKEPATLMYWQQGVKSQLYAWMDRHAVLKNVIVLDDSSVNADWALTASGTGDYSTIDLSNASDSVSYELVKFLFQGTSFEPIIDALRAPVVELPDGRRMKQNKFAPMGNALCFPIESIVFSSIIEATMRSAGLTNCWSLYKVYGDDMIVPDYFNSKVQSNLELLGFQVNSAKTFAGYDFGFRESCGVEGYLGEDVTPLRISRRFKSALDISPSSYSCYDRFLHQKSLVPLYNALFARDYHESQLALSLLIQPRYHIYSYPGEPGLWSWCPTNYHLDVAKSAKRKLQCSCYFIEAWSLRAKCEDALRLHDWFCRFGSDDTDLTEARVSKIGKETATYLRRVAVLH